MMKRTILMLIMAANLILSAISSADDSALVGDLAAISVVRSAAPALGSDSFPFSPIAASSHYTEELLASSDDPLLANDRVNEQIRYFMTVGRPQLQNWLDRSARYIPLMKKIFQENNLPEDLVYVAMIESGLRMNAVSPSRAVGPWQFMAETASEYGLTMNEWVDERRDPVKATRAAAAYLGDLRDYFGSWHVALASYNAGMGKVRRALLLSHDKGFPDIYDLLALREETRNYVPKLLAAITIARDPEYYGFIVKYRRAFCYDELTLEKSAALHDIAVFTGCSVEEIKRLNPELQGWTTPPHARDYVLRIPVGAKKRYLAVLRLFHLDLTPRKSRFDFDTAFSIIDKTWTHEYAVLRKRDALLSATRMPRSIRNTVS